MPDPHQLPLLAACLRTHLARLAGDDLASDAQAKFEFEDEMEWERQRLTGAAQQRAGKTPASFDEASAAGNVSVALDRATAERPRAGDLSAREIEACLARGEDPWADGETCAATPIEAPIGATAIRLARLLPVLVDPALQPILRDPGLVLLCASGDMTTRQCWQTATGSILLTLNKRGPDLPARDFPVIDILPPRSGLAPRDLPRLPFAARAALSRGERAILIGDEDDLADEARPFLHRHITPWPLGRALVCAALKVTHSRTGQIAEAAVRSRLPEDADLARLSDLELDAGFARNSSLRVAEALSGFAARSGPTPTPKAITLASLYGLPAETWAEIEAVLGDLRAWANGDLAWSDVPAGLLLSGPPGTGKTTLARALAGELGWSIVETSYADCQSRDAGHLGTTLRHIRERFDAAAAIAPAILFFDEFDSFAKRSESEGRYGDRYLGEVVNGMLQQMNRVAEMPGVLFVGATNRAGRIDPAIARSGRIDRNITVDLPDLAGLQAILAHYLARDGIPDSTRNILARRLLGLSGADIETLVKRAHSLARNAGESLSGHHLQRAADALVRPHDPDLMHRIAIHEAGHALAARILGRQVRRVTIHSEGGTTETDRPAVQTRATIEDDLTVAFAGRAAERLIFGDVASGSGNGGASDLAIATRHALLMIGQWGLEDNLAHYPDAALHDPATLPAGLREGLERHLGAAESRADEFLEGRQAEITNLALRLAAAGEIDAAGVETALTGSGDAAGSKVEEPDADGDQ